MNKKFTLSISLSVLVIILISIFTMNFLMNELPNSNYNSSTGQTDDKTDTSSTDMKTKDKFYITVNNHRLAVALEDNDSAKSLVEHLEIGNLVVEAKDYNNFEKVGDLGFSLPTSNEVATTTPGDVVFYQDNQLAICYGETTWDFTKLGHINASQTELQEILGSGNATLVLSIR